MSDWGRTIWKIEGASFASDRPDVEVEAEIAPSNKRFGY